MFSGYMRRVKNNHGQNDFVWKLGLEDKRDERMDFSIIAHYVLIDY
jgi:hypothetical protein